MGVVGAVVREGRGPLSGGEPAILVGRWAILSFAWNLRHREFCPGMMIPTNVPKLELHKPRAPSSHLRPLPSRERAHGQSHES